VEDPQRKRNIGALGKAIESMLGKERGRRVCHGLSTGTPADLSEAEKWGIEENQLRDIFRKKTAVSLSMPSVLTSAQLPPGLALTTASL
jgi:hypothetical protein